jgi:hypothetical protein
MFFIALLAVLLLVGLFVPVAKEMKGHLDLDYFKKLLMENSKSLTIVWCDARISDVLQMANERSPSLPES